MAGHEVYATSALSVVAAILLARWCLAGGRSGRPRPVTDSRRASRWAVWREVRRTGSTVAQAGQRLPTDAPCVQRAVQESEDLMHG
jgi:hypothetical protein